MIKNLIWSLIITGLTTGSIVAEEKENDPFADAIKGILSNAIQQQLQNGPPQREIKPEQKPKTNFNKKPSKSDTAIQIVEARIDGSTARIKGKLTGVTLPARGFISEKVIQSGRQGYFSYET